MAHTHSYTLSITCYFASLGSDQYRRPKSGEYDGLLASWDATTSEANLVVAKDGSGTHRTINEALAALGRMGGSRPGRVVIYVKSGVYDEKVEIEKSMGALMFVGDGRHGPDRRDR